MGYTTAGGLDLILLLLMYIVNTYYRGNVSASYGKYMVSAGSTAILV